MKKKIVRQIVAFLYVFVRNGNAFFYFAVVDAGTRLCISVSSSSLLNHLPMFFDELFHQLCLLVAKYVF